MYLACRHGADTAIIGPDGVRPLHDAAEMGFTAIVDALLRNGADPQVRTLSQFTKLVTVLGMSCHDWLLRP